MGNVIMSGIVPPLEKPVGLPALSTIAEGSIVKLNENGSPVEFYVAKHDYESGLNGAGRTLLVRKDCHSMRVWDAGGVNSYPESDIASWLNGDYKALLNAKLQDNINTTSFYYVPGSTPTGSTKREVLQQAVFMLSLIEMGGSEKSYAPTVDGGELSIADSLRIAYLNGSAVIQWTRSPSLGSSGSVCALSTTGVGGIYTITNAYGVRPCFTLPATALVAEDGTIIV